MKLLLICMLLVILFSAVAAADSGCIGTSGIWADMTEYTNCVLDKPVETVVGDLVTVNCVENNREGSTWVSSPLNGASIHIVGYDLNKTPIEEMWDSLLKGTYSFRPGVEGSYLVEISGYNPLGFSVGYNPLLDAVADNMITGAAIIPEPSAPDVADVPETVVVEEPKMSSLLDVVLNCTSGVDEKAKREVPSLMLMLVNLIIA